MDGTPTKGNVKNPAIRRIHADIRELRTSPSDQYHAVPLEENLFEWHFTIRGPSGTDFEGGVYHGRILLPPDYPFKPPNIILLTPNGRFEVGKKICLSISAYHPEHWQPAWGIRLILEALISFLPTDPNGAVGSLDWTPQERRRLAKDSVSWCCPRCGELSSLLPEQAKGEEEGGSGSGGSKPSIYAEEIAQMYIRAPSEEQGGGGDEGGAASPRTIPTAVPTAVDQSATTTTPPPPAPTRAPATTTTAATTTTTTTTTTPAPARTQRRQQEEGEEDRLLYIALALVVAITALIIRKVLRAYEISA